MPSNPDAPSLLRTESSGSASVTWLDRAAAKRAAEAAARALPEQHPEITRVLLFGSLARGDAVPGSDVDLLVILSGSELPFLERIPLYTPAVDGLHVDVFPYTEAEFARLRAEGHPLVRAALREGEWLVGGP